MNVVGQGRILIVDDDIEGTAEEPGEAMAMIQAFAKWGSSAIFFSGNVEDLPEEPLRGIRLAVLDMDLANRSPAEPKDVIAPVLGVLKKVISSDNGPYLAIAWTKHREFLQAFSESAAQLPCPPTDVLLLDKTSMKDPDNGQFDLELIMKSVREKLAEVGPAAFLGLWENLVHEAASETVRQLTTRSADWKEDTSGLLAHLLKSAGTGADLKNNGDSLRVLMSALNPLHFDSAEAAAAQSASSDADVVQQLRKRAVEGEQSSGSQLVGAVNRKLMLGEPHSKPAPGNIYYGPDLVKSLDERPPLPSVGQIWRDIYGLKAKLGQPERVFIEISPLCDFSQGHMKTARLMAGLAVKFDGLSRNQRKNLRTSSPAVLMDPVICFEKGPLKGDRVLVWNARFLVSAQMSKVERCEPLCRLRLEPLVHHQSWAAGHASRPGFLSVR